MIKLYETTFCPYCDIVKDRLNELGLEFESVIVPSPRHRRKIVQELSGQSLVPIIVDGDEVINDSQRIIEYLSKYQSNTN
ncbi:MAG: glutathione S-transferase N-terminal domain-containing protein [Candidatus Marinimicrobia bacterium]|nr:glutathione S-transferase N-terminal domain-containing protein [Candidatus Neomarinimicrobiota bacterium]